MVLDALLLEFFFLCLFSTGFNLGLESFAAFSKGACVAYVADLYLGEKNACLRALCLDMFLIVLNCA